MVDDGSGEREQTKLRTLLAAMEKDFPGLCSVIVNEANRGKGFAVRAGWAAAPDAARLLGFIDADGSVDGTAFLQLLERALAEPGETLVAGSRRLAASDSRRSLHRRGLSRLFYFLVERSYRLGMADTQCGCKLIGKAAYGRFAAQCRQNGFGFDIELLRLAKAHGIRIVETPVVWNERAGSTVTLSAAIALYLNVIRRRF